MTAFVLSLCISVAVIVTTVVVALRRYGLPRLEVRIPDPEPETEAEQAKAKVPSPDTRPPSWLLTLKALGFQTFESDDISISAASPHVEYTICVGTPHPYDVCSGCNARAVRMLGETSMADEGTRIFWIGEVCGRCGNVSLTSPNAPRFLNLMLIDSRSMLTMVTQAKQHAGKPFNELVTAMLVQHEGVLQARINRSSTLRAELPLDEKKAKVLLFERGRRPRKRRRDRL